MSEQEYPAVSCRECGKTQQATYMTEIRDKMVAEQLCFGCLFWTEYARRVNEPCMVRDQLGHHYVIGQEDGPSGYFNRGFGGSKFHVRFHDGREVITTNLWHQGMIPERFRERMPPNAEFITNG